MMLKWLKKITQVLVPYMFITYACTIQFQIHAQLQASIHGLFLVERKSP